MDQDWTHRFCYHVSIHLDVECTYLTFVFSYCTVQWVEGHTSTYDIALVVKVSPSTFCVVWIEMLRYLRLSDQCIRFRLGYHIDQTRRGGIVQKSCFSSSMTEEQSKHDNNQKPAKRQWKILKTRDKKPLIQQQRQRNSLLEKKAAEMKLDWRIMGSTFVLI